MRKIILLIAISLMLGGCAGTKFTDATNFVLDMVDPKDYYR